MRFCLVGFGLVMPIYEYQCGACGHRLEKLQKVAAPQLRDCPACDKPALSKLVSAAAFRLKGSGWYETDFKHSGRKPPPSGDSKPGEGKAADGKTDKLADGKAEQSKAPADSKADKQPGQAAGGKSGDSGSASASTR